MEALSLSLSLGERGRRCWSGWDEAHARRGWPVGGHQSAGGEKGP